MHNPADDLVLVVPDEAGCVAHEIGYCQSCRSGAARDALDRDVVDKRTAVLSVGREQGDARVAQGLELVGGDGGVSGNDIHRDFEEFPLVVLRSRNSIDSIECFNILDIGHQAQHDGVGVGVVAAFVVFAVDPEADLQRVDAGSQLGQCHIAVAFGVGKEEERLGARIGGKRPDVGDVRSEGVELVPARRDDGRSTHGPVGEVLEERHRLCQALGGHCIVAVDAVFAVTDDAEGVGCRRIEIGEGVAHLGRIVDKLRLCAHLASHHRPAGFVAAGDEREADAVGADTFEEDHRRIALAFGTALREMEHHIVAIRQIKIIHKQVVVESVLVAAKRDGLAAGRMATETIAVVVAGTRIVDHSHHKAAATVVVEVAAVEGEGVPPCGAVQRTFVDQSHIVGVDKVARANALHRRNAQIDAAAVLGCHRQRVGNIVELDGADGSSGVELGGSEELLAERIVVPVVDGKFEMIGAAEARYSVGAQGIGVDLVATRHCGDDADIHVVRHIVILAYCCDAQLVFSVVVQVGQQRLHLGSIDALPAVGRGVAVLDLCALVLANAAVAPTCQGGTCRHDRDFQIADAAASRHIFDQNIVDIGIVDSTRIAQDGQVATRACIAVEGDFEEFHRRAAGNECVDRHEGHYVFGVVHNAKHQHGGVVAAGSTGVEADQNSVGRCSKQRHHNVAVGFGIGREAVGSCAAVGTAPSGVRLAIGVVGIACPAASGTAVVLEAIGIGQLLGCTFGGKGDADSSAGIGFAAIGANASHIVDI